MTQDVLSTIINTEMSHDVFLKPTCGCVGKRHLLGHSTHLGQKRQLSPLGFSFSSIVGQTSLFPRTKPSLREVLSSRSVIEYLAL
mmetsp:Transcript_17483/g.25871  ORF Transcript_17483/g.25871 Transcript_17483/m.25871 type:complete len:85 (-) Transcript_17483:1529-1783(-)